LGVDAVAPALLRPRSTVKQRNDALAHRDKMRRQRDEARSQRDLLKDQLRELTAGHDIGPIDLPGVDRNRADHLAANVNDLRAALDRLAAELGLAPEKAPSEAPQHLTQVELLNRVFSYANFFKLEHARREREPRLRAKLAAGERLSTTEHEVLVPRYAPVMHKRLLERRTPPESVAFLTVANARFMPGLVGLLLSLLDVYPDLRSDVLIYHDGSLTDFAQRRLRDIYPRISFFVPDMDWLELVARESDNHKRIGKLGYMNLYAFAHSGYERVIVLDADLLILDDISALWTGDDDAFRACHDCGDREYVAMSLHTGSYIVNSGVISIPKRYLNAETFEEVKRVACDSLIPLDDLIDRFADQKTWNMFLAGKPVSIAEVNYNCNVKYIIRHLGGNLEGVSIAHFAGAKPWNNQLYLHDELVTEFKPKALAFPKIWSDQYRRLSFKHRLASFRRDTAADRRTPVLEPTPDSAPTCVMIGNGPSIADTPLENLQGLECFCFNWFILHDRFEDVRPQHLVLASHMFFGGWNTLSPEFPAGYLQRLGNLRHKPVLWISYYFKPLIESLGLHADFEVNYLLFEKPFKRFVDSLGASVCDIEGFLDDCRTGVLSFGAPIATALGFKRMVLVGCDSNYNVAPGGRNYFYNEALHTSLSTKSDALTATWQPGGPGHFAYEVVGQALRRKGVELLDSTVGGGLPIPKLPIAELVADAEKARRSRAASPTRAYMAAS
jgi:lipopolysaccharide biosynthesis glycosyltransferase